MDHIIGPTVHGMLMHKYGLPYRNAAGHIFPDDLDLVERMLVVVEQHPELHILTHLDRAEDCRIVNYYEPKNAWVHYLCTGNSDPEIEFTREYRRDDTTPEDRARWEKFLAENRDKPYSSEEISAINFAISVNSKLKRAW